MVGIILLYCLCEWCLHNALIVHFYESLSNHDNTCVTLFLYQPVLRLVIFVCMATMVVMFFIMFLHLFQFMCF